MNKNIGIKYLKNKINVRINLYLRIITCRYLFLDAMLVTFLRGFSIATEVQADDGARLQVGVLFKAVHKFHRTLS